MDGSQTMLLRCLKHHQSLPSASVQVEDDFDFIRIGDPQLPSIQLCPMALMFKTTFDGYWQLLKEDTEYCHLPLLQPQTHKMKAASKMNKTQGSNKFDDIINQKAATSLRAGLHELFDDEFCGQKIGSNLQTLNHKIKKNHISSIFMEDDNISTKPSISPVTPPLRQLEANHDDFFGIPKTTTQVLE